MAVVVRFEVSAQQRVYTLHYGTTNEKELRQNPQAYNSELYHG
jgi:hypothetical protein